VLFKDDLAVTAPGEIFGVDEDQCALPRLLSSLFECLRATDSRSGQALIVCFDSAIRAAGSDHFAVAEQPEQRGNDSMNHRVQARATRLSLVALVVSICLSAASTTVAQAPSMLDGNGWRTDVVFTVGKTFADGYQPPGILDGIGAFATPNADVKLLVNHELNPGNGYAYTLANGTTLTGARVSSFEVSRVDGQYRIISAGPAYDTIYDRNGVIVTDPAQVNETGNAIDGLARFCSSQGVQGGTFGFVDDLYFCGEETGKPFHPHGGTAWVINVAGEAIWAMPGLGRGAWENFTPVDTGDANTVGLLLGDDTQSAPLYLYVGQKNSIGDSSFLDRNGLAVGQLYVWVADSGDLDPQSFNGNSANLVRSGSFQPITARDVAMAGALGFDAMGFKDSDTLQGEADAMGAFSFSRPEDLHTNPVDGTQVVFASTGRGSVFPADNWGTLYLLDLDFTTTPGSITCSVEILFDGDAQLDPDAGIRSPDNLVWATDGKIYVQEDRSTSPSSLFGGSTGIEASIWSIDPSDASIERVAVVNRDVVLPAGSTDIGAGSIGNWETSGILDVTAFFDTDPGELVLVGDVQAHGIRDGVIGDNPLLDEGGQLFFMSKGGVMVNGETEATDAGWKADNIFTVSETFGGYQPAGILDGIGAFPSTVADAKILVNHELNPGNGYAYTLANGTMLTGARVSAIEINRNGDDGVVVSAEMAFDKIYDRSGNIVVDPAQVNETGNAIDGLARFCSAQGVLGGTFSFTDDIYFTGEETGKPFHPHGGTAWAIDVDDKSIWAVPALGRGAWENMTPLETGNPNNVALLLGDDTQSAPLYLYVGQKNFIGDNSFLDRNGLAVGQLYVWRADNGDLSPEDFNGAGSVRTGDFAPISVQNPAMAGMLGHDAFGYKDSDVMQAEADALGGFSFSRPEDLHTNPAQGTQAVFASTGRGSVFPSDNWGTIYTVDVTFGAAGISATLEIIHDADGLADPDTGIRSPDNLVWANDGFVYVQEDRSTSPSSLFGGSTGIEASIWQLCPTSGGIKRIFEVDRDVVLPAGSTDIGAGSIGNWETSGVLDVTNFFPTEAGERLLIANIQAHGIRDGLIGDNALLDEGGQLVFLSRKASFPGTNEDLAMSVRVNGQLDTCSAPDHHEVRGGDVVSVQVLSPEGSQDFRPLVIIGQARNTGSGFLPNTDFGGVWLTPGANPAPFVIIDSVATPLGQSNLLQPQGNSYVFQIGPAVSAGLSIMTQSFILDGATANGIFATSQGQVLDLVN
jgi:secreted PhoX family phosphatase